MAQSGKYNWTVCVRWRCSHMSNYFWPLVNNPDLNYKLQRWTTSCYKASEKQLSVRNSVNNSNHQVKNSILGGKHASHWHKCQNVDTNGLHLIIKAVKIETAFNHRTRCAFADWHWPALLSWKSAAIKHQQSILILCNSCHNWQWGSSKTLQHNIEIHWQMWS